MENTALVLIDFQKGFDDPIWGERNNLDAENNAQALLNVWREKNLPVIHIQHCSTDPSSPLNPDKKGNEFKVELQPMNNEKIFKKSVNSGFIGTQLESFLHSSSITSLVVGGLTTDHCVSTTTRMAGNLGFNVTLISDACATFDRNGVDGEYYSADQIHAIHLASLNAEFCKVCATGAMMNVLDTMDLN